MALSFASGTSGRVASVTFTASTTSDMPPGQGDGASLGTPPTQTSAADVKSWKFDDGVQNEGVVTFESPTNADGVVYPIHLRGGISTGAKAAITGTYTIDTGSALPSSARFRNGAYVYVDLIINKQTGFGYLNFVAKVTNYSHGAEASGKPQDFSCTLEFVGAPPLPSLT